MSEIGESLLRGAKEALAYASGDRKGSKTYKIKVPLKVDVLKIRKNLHMTRREFSEVFGFSIRTLEKWERRERSPEGPARAYLTVIAKAPEAVRHALQ